jgi:hypothetical protein
VANVVRGPSFVRVANGVDSGHSVAKGNDVGGGRGVRVGNGVWVLDGAVATSATARLVAGDAFGSGFGVANAEANSTW